MRVFWRSEGSRLNTEDDGVAGDGEEHDIRNSSYTVTSVYSGARTTV